MSNPKLLNLYLDDNRIGPYNDFISPPLGWEDWVIVRSVDNAKRLLELNLVNHLSLDHDLGFNSKTGEENHNGRKLVLWMIETGNWPSGEITIHSQNLKDALKMKEDIDKYRPI